MKVQQPLVTGAAAVFDWSDLLAKRFTIMSRFDEPVQLWREIGAGANKKILLPRQICPVGKVDRREIGPLVNLSSSFKPRSAEQARVVDETYKRLVAGENFLVQAPTGFGKTWCMLHVIARYGRRTCIVVNKEDVRDQWIEAAVKVLDLPLKDIGIIQGDHVSVDPFKPLVIAMIQSVSKFGRYPASTYRGFGLVVWDEVHHVGADVFSNSAFQFPARCRVGLSATPHRKDGRESVLHSHIGQVRVRTEHAVLTPKVLVHRTNWKVPMVHWYGQYQPMPHQPGRTMHLNKAMASDLARNMLMVRFVKAAYQKGRSTIVFADTKAHLKNLRELLVVTPGVDGKDLAYYVGGMSAKERDKAKAKPIILATYKMASEATDIPWLDTAVLATPRSDVIQIVGRILREYPDKRPPVVFDLVDDASWVLRAYADKRRDWYKSIGAEVKHVG